MRNPDRRTGWLPKLDPDRRAAFLKTLDRGECDGLRWHWEQWARPQQLPPPGNWRVWLVCAGRGFGKTRAGAEWVRRIAREQADARIALVAASLAEARAVMVEGESGLLACCPPGARPLFEPSLRRLTWPNGAQAFLYSAAEPESLRGPQHSHARRTGAEGIHGQRSPCADRCPAASRRGRRSGQPTARPGRRRLLAGACRPHRRLGGPCRAHRLPPKRNMAVHRAARRNARIQPRDRARLALRRGLAGGQCGNGTGGRCDGRCRSPRRNRRFARSSGHGGHSPAGPGLIAHQERAASISINCRMGATSYPPHAAAVAMSSTLRPRLASASDHSSVDRVPERQ